MAAKVPQEVLLHVFSYLAPKDLLSCSEVCRKWRHVASDNVLWNKLYPGLDTRFSIMGLVKPRIVTNETELLDRILKYAKHHNSRITKFFTLNPPSAITVKISSVIIRDMLVQKFTIPSVCFPCSKIKHGYDKKLREQINLIQDSKLVHYVMSDEEKRRKVTQYMCLAFHTVSAALMLTMIAVIAIVSAIVKPSSPP